MPSTTSSARPSFPRSQQHGWGRRMISPLRRFISARTRPLTSPARRCTSTAEWPCFEPLTTVRRRQRRPTPRRIWAYSQGVGSMITEPAIGRAKNALQEFETLYIGGAKPADVRRVQGHDRAESLSDCEGSLTTTMARIVFGIGFGIVLGPGPMGTSTRMNDE